MLSYVPHITLFIYYFYMFINSYQVHYLTCKQTGIVIPSNKLKQGRHMVSICNFFFFYNYYYFFFSSILQNTII